MQDLPAKIESLLFVTNRPLTVKQLISLTGSDAGQIKQALDVLEQQFSQPDRGVVLQRLPDSVQLVTAGEQAKLVQSFVHAETTGELTKAALETLTIVAYRGPITRAELEQIRGVNCAIILRNLMIRGLVSSQEEKSKLRTTYQVTHDFLSFLGLGKTADLPDYEMLNASQSLDDLLKRQPTQ